MPPCLTGNLEQAASTSSCTASTHSSAVSRETPSSPRLYYTPSPSPTPSLVPLGSGGLISSDYAALLVGTVSGGLVLICITVSLCFWFKKRYGSWSRPRGNRTSYTRRARPRRTFHHKQLSGEPLRRSRWQPADESEPQSSIAEKSPISQLDEKDMGLPLLPKHVFKYETMKASDDPFANCLIPESPPSYLKIDPASQVQIRAAPTFQPSYLPANALSGDPTKQGIIGEATMYPAPLNPKPKPISLLQPPPSAKIASSIKSPDWHKPSLTALPTYNPSYNPSYSGPRARGSHATSTAELLPARAFSRSHNPIRKSWIHIVFMGNGPSRESRRGNSLTQSAARLAAGPMAITSAIFGSRKKDPPAPSGLVDRCSLSSSVYTVIESASSVYGDNLEKRRMSSDHWHSRAQKRFPVRPPTSLKSGSVSRRHVFEQLGRLSRASRSSDALPKQVRVRFRTPSMERQRGKRHIGHASHPDALMPPPVPPKSARGSRYRREGRSRTWKEKARADAEAGRALNEEKEVNEDAYKLPENWI